METISIREFAAERNLVEVAKKTRVNNNGYGYITFIDIENVAMNVYFSKALDSEVAEGTPVNKDFLSDKVIAIVENSDGELRYKLSSKGTSGRVELAEIL